MRVHASLTASQPRQPGLALRESSTVDRDGEQIEVEAYVSQTHMTAALAADGTVRVSVVRGGIPVGCIELGPEVPARC